MKPNQRLIPPLKNSITPKGFFKWLLVAVLLVAGDVLSAQPVARSGELMEVGVARIDITPTGPIRLAGYGIRKKTESEGVLQPLGAKAMAFGTDAQGPSIFITVDLLGIPANITRKLTDQLSAKIGMDAARLVICASHTHGGPELGNTLNILQYRGKTFSDSMLAVDHLIRIAEYTEQLSQKLEQVALEAMKNRSPSSVSWGQGQAGFAKNRRPQGGPVDPSLPLLRVTDENGKLKAVLVNYACHGTTLGGDVNKVHGDWMGEAQRLIEGNHPGAIAMVAIGCGADANPDPRGTIEHVRLYGQEISNQVEKLLASPLQPLSSPPQARIKWVKLPFAHVPDVSELIKQTEDKSVKGYYARLSLDRLARGQSIPIELSYPVQTWAFGDELLMINLAGEVVADYSVRLKNELGADKLWINGYANDAPCYIASRRVIREGGYEAETSMYYYDKPGPFVEEVEDIIVEAVHTILPVSYTLKRDTVNHPQVVRSENNGELNLRAEVAHAIGPEIKYMPEWKAFGWFTEADRVEWDIEVRGNGKYDVYLDWSVSDQESGKHFIFEVAGKKLNGRIGKTGSWFTYKTEKIGTIRLSAGSHKVVFRPALKTEKGALLDMRTISLIPVK